MAQVRVSLDWPVGVFLVGGQWFTAKKVGQIKRMDVYSREKCARS